METVAEIIVEVLIEIVMTIPAEIIKWLFKSNKAHR